MISEYQKYREHNGNVEVKTKCNQRGWRRIRDALREYLAKGMSFAEIADALNAKFGTAYSRNAAIGRARRMGLSVPRAARGQRLALAEAADAAGQSRRGWRTPRERLRSGLPAADDRHFERAERARLRCVEIMPRHLALVDLEANDCRYPYGGDEEGDAITFCGHPRHEGSSYCVSHFHLTNLPEAVPEPAARARSPLRLVEAA